MDIESIPKSYLEGLELRHLRVLDVLLRERSLTRAAEVLDVTQPALSKTLAKLRRYFDDPLFVRVSLKMEPTAKALALREPIRGVLDRVQELQSHNVPFDPATSDRAFDFCVVDAGIIKMLPSVIQRLSERAPRIQLRAIQFDAELLDSGLESGAIDFAVGSFPSLGNGIRRKRLWIESYVSVVNKGHPRLNRRPNKRAFAAEKHVLVSTAGTGHSHQLAEAAVEAMVPPENIVCRVPMFIAAAVIAKHTDTVATLPLSIATVLGEDLDLDIIEPPIKLPRLEISLYWHERFHREPGNEWVRAMFADLFGETGTAKAA